MFFQYALLRLVSIAALLTLAACQTPAGTERGLLTQIAGSPPDGFIESSPEEIQAFPLSPENLYVVSKLETFPGLPGFCKVRPDRTYEVCSGDELVPKEQSQSVISAALRSGPPAFIIFSAEDGQYAVGVHPNPEAARYAYSRRFRAFGDTLFSSRNATFVFEGGPGSVVFMPLTFVSEGRFGEKTVRVLTDDDARQERIDIVFSKLEAVKGVRREEFNVVYADPVAIKGCRSEGFLGPRICSF